MRELTVDGEDVMERTGRENLKEDAVTEREIAMAGTEKGVEGDYEVLISVDGYSSFKTSLGDRTLTGDSRFNVLSPEKIEQSNFNASAKYGTSFGCVDRNLLASGKNSRNCDDGTIVISHSSISSYRLANDSLILSDNSTAFSSLNSLLDTILFSRASLSNFSLTNLLTANDQSISETCSTSNFKSSGILITNSAISITYNNIGTEYINTLPSTSRNSSGEVFACQKYPYYCFLVKIRVISWLQKRKKIKNVGVYIFPPTLFLFWEKRKPVLKEKNGKKFDQKKEETNEEREVYF